MRKKFFFVAFIVAGFLLFNITVEAQNVGRQYSLNFYQSFSDSDNFHSSLRDYILQPEFNLPYDSSKKRSWFHRKLLKEHLLEFNKPDYSFYLSILPDILIGSSSDNKLIWLDTRGIIVGGSLGKHLSFRTEFYENQGDFPAYIDKFVHKERVVSGQGVVKNYNNGRAFDFAYSSALISYSPNRFLNFQLGYGKNFIGDGYRSMLLSDNSFNYPFLKITVGAGRLKYMSMWAQFIDLKSPAFSYNNGYRKKWGVFHYLDWNATDKFSIGLFESVIWQDADSTGKRGFDVSYLNPIIFLRPVEFAVGSPDNALMGLNAKYAITPNSTLYGQFLLDEFKLKEMIAGNGWWGNKFGGQLGFRSNNIFGVSNLNMLTEFNAARPFTYSQRNSLLAYGHYNQPLADPLGANFIEWVNLADYRYKRWYFRGELLWAKYGLDSSASVNYGKNIFKSYYTRNKEYNNHIGQGLQTSLVYLQGTVAFLLNPKDNLRLEISVAARQEKNNLISNRELFFTIGLRSTFRRFYYDF